MRRNDPPDFSSLQYWSDRFIGESAFEWLSPSAAILPLVLTSAEAVCKSTALSAPHPSTPDKAFRILHFGCGSSSLGSDLQHYLTACLLNLPLGEGKEVKVVDADYVLPSLLSSRVVSVVQVDMLDIVSLKGVTEGQWDLVIDKSTADAISCGPSITRSSSALSSETHSVPPLEVLCDNLSQVTRKGGRWLSISYSATRYEHLLPIPTGTSAMNTASDSAEPVSPTWRLVVKQPLTTASMPEGRVIPDGKGFRTVYEPETPIWLYILERV